MSEEILLPAGIARRRHRLASGETLFRRGERVRRMYLVRAGGVRLLRHLPRGGALSLQRAGAGDWLAEASLFADCYHCDAVADGAELLSVARANLLQALHDEPALMALWLRTFGREVQRLRGRAEALACRTVAERLDAWLTLHDGSTNDMSWSAVAADIAVSPAALYRELAKRRSGQG